MAVDARLGMHCDSAPGQAALAFFATVLSCLAPPAHAATEMVDTALILAVDVSNSVDEDRYALQMEGIAATFEDPEVERAMVSGPHRAMFVMLVEWSNNPVVTVPWTLITGAADARAFAAEVRKAPRAESDFTCMSRTLQAVHDQLVPALPVPATRIVIDVSSDGRDNCNLTPPVEALRDQLVATGVTINGMPILEGTEMQTLEGWYKENVIGGSGAFTLPVQGYEDFARAMRRKFLTEVSERL